MKITVIGTGNVGGTLGRRLSLGGHEVTFGSRHPDDPKVQKLLKDCGTSARALSVPESVAVSDVVVLAVPWTAVQEVLHSAGDLRNKILIDCTNPLEPDLRGLAIGHSTSAAEQVAQWAKGAHVVKAFNTTGAGNMANPKYGDQAVTMFVCGDNPDAKSFVLALARELGFDAVDSGPLVVARYLEPLAMLWIHLAYIQGFGTDFAFKLLKR